MSKQNKYSLNYELNRVNMDIDEQEIYIQNLFYKLEK